MRRSVARLGRRRRLMPCHCRPAGWLWASPRPGPGLLGGVRDGAQEELAGEGGVAVRRALPFTGQDRLPEQAGVAAGARARPVGAGSRHPPGDRRAGGGSASRRWVSPVEGYAQAAQESTSSPGRPANRPSQMDIQVAARRAPAVGPLVEGSAPVLPDPGGVLEAAACRIVHTTVGGGTPVGVDRQQPRVHERPGRWASRVVDRLQGRS